jgi:DNA-directed RNA polymerase specialized sigma subunit
MDYGPHRATEHARIFATPGDVEQIELHSALQTLPLVQRLILIGIHACGFQKTELAVRLGYSERHIARLEKRALASLQVSMS